MTEREQKGFDLALNYLGYRKRSVKKVEDYLERKGFLAETPAILEKLTEYRYLDDEAYMRSSIETNQTGKRYGKRRMIESLRQDGLSEILIGRIDEIFTRKMQESCLVYHAKKAIERTQGEPYRRRIRHIQSYLVRRGFSNEASCAVLRTISPEDCSVNLEKFEKDFKHYDQLYDKKGLDGFEKQSRLCRSLLARGYEYDLIRMRIEQSQDEEPED